MSGTLIEQIRAKITAGEFEFTRHALDQSVLRHISVQEVRDIVQNAEVIEDYPDDKYGPSCLAAIPNLKFGSLEINTFNRTIYMINSLNQPPSLPSPIFQSAENGGRGRGAAISCQSLPQISRTWIFGGGGRGPNAGKKLFRLQKLHLSIEKWLKYYLVDNPVSNLELLVV